jgi:L-alanine-DL-glutamate epimerase-like enolase superfamily enzyme
LCDNKISLKVANLVRQIYSIQTIRRYAVQIHSCNVIPIELNLRRPARMANMLEITHVQVVFVHIETVQGQSAWGCAVAHPQLTGETPEKVIQACQACAAAAPDLHPTDLEYSLAKINEIAHDSMGAQCAFDLAFHDLLGLASGMSLFRLLGGYRNSIPTSITIPLGSAAEAVSQVEARAKNGFRMFKIKGGADPEEDVRRVRAVHRAMPGSILRLDADGGYSVQTALDVVNAVGDRIEMIEQPTPPEDLDALRQVKAQSAVPVLADQSVSGPDSALELAASRAADGLCVKIGRCGGLRCAGQVDAIARAAQMSTMVSCVIGPALLISAGLSFALSSPNVQYADLDGHFEIVDDPSQPAFTLEDGWLTAAEVPGLGCWVDLA